MRLTFAVLLVLSAIGCAKAPPNAWDPAKHEPQAAARDSDVIRFGQGPSRPRSDADVDEFLERKERWPVKVGADERAKTIAVGDEALDKATVKSVADLVQIERPHGLPDQGHGNEARSVRFGKEETTVYRVDCVIVSAKMEDNDKDYHLVIRDPYGDPDNTMIAEIPRPDVVPEDSPFRDRIIEARDEFTRRFRPEKKFNPINARVRMWGVGFFDFVHGQRGVAPNGIELHPVLKIEYR